MQAVAAQIAVCFLYQRRTDLLSAIEQAGQHEVASQFELNALHVLAGQPRLAENVFMHDDSLVELTPTPQQTTQGQMGFERIVVHFEVIDKGRECPVRLFVQQVIQALVIIGADYVSAFLALAPAKPPADANGRENQNVKQAVFHMLYSSVLLIQC